MAEDEGPLVAIIVGTGFGGIGMAIQLKQAGIHNFLLLEQADDLGGCWRDNTYPGAECDVPSHLYSFSFEPKLDWSKSFAPQSEILDYIRHCARKYGVEPHIRYRQQVVAAEFDADNGYWQVSTATGESFVARCFIPACGQLSRPLLPRIAGLENFAGKQFHSANWDHDYDLRGKRVAVIGSGASAIQFVPVVAEQAQQTLLFQRSAPYILPKPDRAYAAWELALMRRLPLLHRLSRSAYYLQHEVRAIGFSKITSTMALFKPKIARYMRRLVVDPVLRAKLTPDYPLGCKRILMSNNYFQALTRHNVDVLTQEIVGISADAVLTGDGKSWPVDAIIFGTGFQATDFLAPISVRGLDGQDLNQVWRDGAEAYLGICVSDFPNLFMLYGPNTNLGHNSILFMLECQMRYVLSCIRYLQEHPQPRCLDVLPRVQQRFNRRLQQQIRRTVWEQGCRNWYRNAAGKNTNNWPGFTLSYRYLTRRIRPQDYRSSSAGLM